MDIGGFQKNSLIDFPGTIAGVVFTQGCNFICPFCHNPDLVPGPKQRTGNLCDEEGIFGFLEQRKGFLEGVVITGGEPTLQRDLPEFLRRVKQMGYRVKLDTNGTRPAVLAALFDDNLVDYAAMDIKTCLEDYHLVFSGKPDTRKIEESIRLLMDRAPAYEFRTTCVRPFVSPEIMVKIRDMIKGASQYALQNCSKRGKVLDPEFLTAEERFFSDDEMHELQKIIEPYVKTMLVR